MTVLPKRKIMEYRNILALYHIEGDKEAISYLHTLFNSCFVPITSLAKLIQQAIVDMEGTKHSCRLEYLGEFFQPLAIHTKKHLYYMDLNPKKQIVFIERTEYKGYSIPIWFIYTLSTTSSEHKDFVLHKKKLDLTDKKIHFLAKYRIDSVEYTIQKTNHPKRIRICIPLEKDIPTKEIPRFLSQPNNTWLSILQSYQQQK